MNNFEHTCILYFSMIDSVDFMPAGQRLSARSDGDRDRPGQKLYNLSDRELQIRKAESKDESTYIQ